MFVWHHHSIFFTLFVGPIPVTGAAFSFFFQYSNSLNPVKKKKKNWTSEKKKRKEKKNSTANPGKEKKKKKNESQHQPRKRKKEKKKRTKANANLGKKKKKKNSQRQPRKKKKKKKKWSKVAAVSPLCVFNYNIAIELWVMEIENSQTLFSVFITHNSKIRELSDENRVMKTELLFAKQTFYYGFHHFWVMNYGNRELSYQN